MSGKYKVSLVIPARQSQDTIVPCVSSILSQTHKVNEILLVISEGDTTGQVLRESVKSNKIKIIEIPVNHEYIRDAHYKRWIGAREAKGDLIFFTDSKALLDKNAVEKSIKLLVKHGCHAVAGTAQSWPDEKDMFISKIQDKAIIKNNPNFNKCEWLNKANFGKKESLPVTTALLITKKAFEAIRDDFALEYSKIASTYDDYVTAWLLVKTGFPILLTNSVRSYHKHRTCFSSYLKQISRSGQSAALMAKLYPDCPFGKRRLFEVGLVFLCLFLAMLGIIFSFIILGNIAIWGIIFALLAIFSLLGLINVFLAKDPEAFLIPPITALLI